MRWSCCWSCCQTPSSGMRAQAQEGLGEGVGQRTSAQDAPQALHTPTLPMTTPHSPGRQGEDLCEAPAPTSPIPLHQVS